LSFTNVNPPQQSSTQAFSSLTGRNVGYFLLPYNITVNQISFWVSSAGTAGTAKVCVYTADGATKSIDVTTANISAAGIVSTSVSSVALTPGGYYLVIGCATTCSLTTVSTIVEATSTMFGAGTPSGKTIWHGTVSHASGACNSTLGTITGTTTKPTGLRLDN